MSREYDAYIQEHKENVKKGFEWFEEHMPDLVPSSDCKGYILEHDSSKTNSDEYEAYDKYFYGKNRSYAVVNEFNLAWLRHIHRNKHHWQHWVLINDDPKEGTVALDMPLECIIEMICDWWAFSWAKGDLKEIFKWYDAHKKHIIFSDSTRETVEYILDRIKEAI